MKTLIIEAPNKPSFEYFSSSILVMFVEKEEEMKNVKKNVKYFQNTIYF